MNYLLIKLKNNWPIVVIFLIWVLASITNYTPDTYLTGWDNLHSEFNFRLNIERSLFAAWQEYQGLGLVGGMGHASDLFRQITLWIFSLFIPSSLLRYLYHFFMILVGMLGTYLTLKNIILEKLPEKSKSMASVLGGIFYFLNLGTIQYFFVPFEPYSTFWGLLPWEMYVLFKYISNPSKKNFFYLALINFFAIAQGYVQTLFLVYMLLVFIVLILRIIKEQTTKSIKNSFLIIFTIFCINAFWLLPNMYFVFTNLSVTENAIQNKMATEKFYQMNKHRGTVGDFSLLRSFYYDFFDFDPITNKSDFLMKAWRIHFSSPIVLFIGYFFFTIIILGLVQKNSCRRYLLGIFLLCSVIFLSDTLLISSINNFFRSFSIVNQIFRNPFTKFIVPAIYVFSLSFAIGMGYILSLRFINKKYISYSVFFLILLALFIYAFPLFKGNLIASQLKVKIPQEYFQLFSFFENQNKNARIMNLPQAGIWGWNYYTWGARGSGFLWYGIKQPIMDRAFDVWSADLERYYWELSYALKKRDVNLFNAIIKKYQIGFILFDQNLLFFDGNNQTKLVYKQQDLLEKNTEIKKIAQFGSITVFKTKQLEKLKENVFLTDKLQSVKRSESFGNKDQAFSILNNYYSSKQGSNSTFIFPFGSLFTNRFQSEHNFQVREEKDNFILEAKAPLGKYTLALPSFTQKEAVLPTKIYAKKQNNTITIKLLMQKPLISVGDKKVIDSSQEKDIKIDFSSGDIPFPLLLDINNKDYLQIKNLSQNFEFIGSTYLVNQKLANYLKVYSEKAMQTLFLTPANFTKTYICGESKQPSSFSAHAEEKELVLNAKNAAICSNTSNQFFGVKKSLMHVSFSYRSSSDEFPQYCVFSKNKKKCLNQKDVIVNGFSEKKALFNDKFELDDTQNDQLNFQLILDATKDEDRDLSKQIRYEDIELNYLPYLTGGIIELNNLEDKPSEVTLDISTETYISISIPKLENSFSSTNPISKNLYKRQPLNYDKLLKGIFSLQELDNGAKTLRLNAKNASSYLLLKNTNLSAGYAYLTTITNKNVENFPFTVNIFTNQDMRNYVYTYAQKNSEYSKDYYILPPLYEFDNNGINVLLGATSYNRSQTVNDISDITIYPIPYEYITNIYFKKNVIAQNNTYLPTFVSKDNVSLYKVRTENSDVKYLVLSQSFNPGWKAYQIKNYESGIMNYAAQTLPFLFGKELKEHVLVNNWSNGWTIQNQISKIKDQNQNLNLKTGTNENPQTIEQLSNSTIVILFWPQYLEYLGFILLFGTFIYMFRYKEK